MKYHLLSELIHQQAEVLKDKEVFKNRNKKTGEWTGISWEKFSLKVLKLAEVLAEWGIKEKDNIGIFSQNMEACFTVDFAAFANRATTVPMYATSSTSQVQFIVDEAEIKLLFVGEQQQYNIAYPVLKESKTLHQLILLDGDIQMASDDSTSIFFDEFIQRPTNATEIVNKRRSEVSRDDVVHILYTSGTTGASKGVMVTHSNYMEAMEIHDERLAHLPSGMLSVCFLPLTHIFEKAWSIVCLHWGDTLAINLDPREIQQTIKELKPNAMCSVPRFWEKVYAGVQEKIESSSPLMRKVFTNAIKVGQRHNLEYRNKNKKAPFWLRVKFNFYDKTVFTMLKKALGIEKGIIWPCAGAALSDTINVFLQSVNLPFLYGYGLTETTATVSCFPVTDFRIGSVGKIMPHVEVKIGENNEILVKGKTVMAGYYKKPEETKNVFTEDGFFKTGDAGLIDENDNIILTERIKDLYKTSNGKYIAPQQIETALSEDKYIDMVAVIGEQRKYVSALIVPSYPELEAYAKEHSIAYKDLKDLCENPAIYELIASRIKPLQKDFAGYEQIKKFTLLPETFSIAGGHLTNTLKLKRPVILEKYKEEIEEMYK